MIKKTENSPAHRHVANMKTDSRVPENDLILGTNSVMRNLSDRLPPYLSTYI